MALGMTNETESKRVNNLPCLAGLLNNDKKRRKQDIPRLYVASASYRVSFLSVTCCMPDLAATPSFIGA
ncbi:hypothetical protein NC651_017357 [Populus alba x Populus x berolinensis]|nr:hypothetical protein NC651_017357 [Populus alba x Populus x berolinensis]